MTFSQNTAFPTGLYYAIDVDLTTPSNAAMLRVLTGQHMGMKHFVQSPKPPKEKTNQTEEDCADLGTVPELLKQFGLSYALSPGGETTKGSPAYTPKVQKPQQQWQNYQRTPTLDTASLLAPSSLERRHDLHCTLWYCRDEIENAKNVARKQANYAVSEKKRQQAKDRYQSALSDPNAFPTLGGGEAVSLPRPPAPVGSGSSPSPSEESQTPITTTTPTTPFDSELNAFWHKWKQYESVLTLAKSGKDGLGGPILLRLEGIYCGGTSPEVAVCAAAVSILDPVSDLCHNRCPHLTITFGTKARASQSNQLLEGAAAALGQWKQSPNAALDWQKNYGNTMQWVPIGEEVLVEGFFTLH